MNAEEIEKLLLSDLKAKKKFAANWDTECSRCADEINEGDSFIFMADSQKICENCLSQIIDFLED